MYNNYFVSALFLRCSNCNYGCPCEDDKLTEVYCINVMLRLLVTRSKYVPKHLRQVTCSVKKTKFSDTPNTATLDNSKPEQKHPDAEKEPLPAWPGGVNPHTGERGGPAGPEPTRYGDWERKGRVSDF